MHAKKKAYDIEKRHRRSRKGGNEASAYFPRPPTGEPQEGRDHWGRKEIEGDDGIKRTCVVASSGNVSFSMEEKGVGGFLQKDCGRGVVIP